MSRAADILLRLGDTNPIVPTSGQISFYAKSNGIFYSLDSNGVETPLGGGTGTVTSIDVSGGTTGLTTIGGPVTNSGTITLSGTLFETHGGTGVNTYITGDMLYASATDTLNKLNIGINGQVLTVSGGVPVWSTPSSGGSVTNVSITNANGFDGTVDNSTTTPAITISTTVTGLVKGNGSAISAATGNDINIAFGTQTANYVYAAPNGADGDPSFRAIIADDIPTLNQDTTGTANNVTGVVTELHGGTGANAYTTGDMLYASATNTLSKRSIGTNGQVLTVSGGVPTWSTVTGTGTVTSVAMSVPDFLSVTGSPVTSSGTLAVSLSGTALPVANGGTGATTANSAFNALAPSQTGNTGKFLTTDGTDTSWTTISGTGSVTSVDVSGGTTGLTTTGGPVTSSGTITLDGILNIANGGTGANTATDARTNLGATTVGSNVFTLTNPGAVTYLRVNADNTISALDAASFRTAIGAGTSSTTGTVTSVDISGGTTGLTTTGGPVTGSGIITLAGTLAIANGGSGANTAAAARTNFGATTVGSGFFTLTNPSAITFPRINADNSVSALDAATFRTAIGAGAGTVTSVAISGGTTGLTTSGGPVTGSGTVTLAGTLAIANGGTGATTQSGAANAILPDQTGNTGKVLTTDGSVVSWTAVSGSGTVTSVSATGSDGVTVTGSPITTSGTISIGLGNITPINVAATGTVTGTNLSGTNTGDQTITLTGDVTGTGTGSFATTLANTSVTAGIYGSSTQVPVITVDSKGRITNVSNTAISGSGSSAPEVIVWHYSSGGSGNFSAVDALYSASSGVTPTITDAANCIATYSFSEKSNLPKSMTIYGQVYSTNSFQIKTTTSLPSASVVGGGTSATPNLISGAFSASNLVTLQTRMSDVGASAGLGQRAWLIVVFGF